MQHKASTTTTKFPETMAISAAPIAIGTRGTVGSLVRKEIEYFSKLELDLNASSRKPRRQVTDTSPRRGSTRSPFWFLKMTWKRKQQRGSKRFLSSMCSVAEVSESNRLFDYSILEDDVQNLNI